MSTALERVYEDFHADLHQKFLEDARFHVHTFREEDGSVTATMDEMDLVVNGKDEQDARMQLVLDVMEYARDYIERFSDYSQAPNRRDHFRYILAIALQNNMQSILAMFHA